MFNCVVIDLSDKNALKYIRPNYKLPQIGDEMGRHEAVWNNYKCKIDLDGTPDRFQAPPGVESGLQGRLMNQVGVLIVWSDVISDGLEHAFCYTLALSCR